MRFASSVWLAALVCVLMGLRPAMGQDEDQRYEISNLDVTIQVQPDGTYEGEEPLTYDFQRGSFTYAYRVLDADDATAVRDVRITSPDVPVDSVRRAAADKDLRIRWTYPERTGPTTFTIRYVVEGALFERGDRNVMQRDVMDSGATVPTHDFDVRVVLPASFDLTPEAVSVEPANGTVEASAGRVVAAFQEGRLEEGETYLVEVAFPWRVSGQYWSTPGDIVFGVFLFLVATGGGIVLNLRWKGARAERDATRPPRDVGLPEGAALLSKTATPLFTALLFDLARRGHLTLQHDEESNWLGTTEVVRIDLHPTSDDLSEDEAAVVDQLDGHETVKAFWQNSSSFRQEQYRSAWKRVLDTGWMTAHRTRSTLCFVGAGVLVVGGIAIGVLTSGLATLLVVSASLGGAIGAMIAGSRRYTMTAEGARRAAALRSYLDHEKEEIDRLRETDPARAAERLADVLPWLMYHDDVSSAWLEEVEDELKDAATVPTLPDGFVSLVRADESASAAAFVPIVAVVSGMEASGAGAAGAAAAAGGAGAGGAAAGGAAGAG